MKRMVMTVISTTVIFTALSGQGLWAEDKINVSALEKRIADLEASLKSLNSVLEQGLSQSTPSKAIMAFDDDQCPTGWVPYQAAEGRFILGANTAHPWNHPTQGGGGAETHTMTEAELFPHTHGPGWANTHWIYTTNGSAWGNRAIASAKQSGWFLENLNEGSKTSSTGQGQAFSIMPPFKALTYCKKQ